jgi:hypothetical protein
VRCCVRLERASPGLVGARSNGDGKFGEGRREVQMLAAIRAADRKRFSPRTDVAGLSAGHDRLLYGSCGTAR